MSIARFQQSLLIIFGLIMVGSVLLIAGLGIRLGIDFTGGALTEVVYVEAPSKIQLESAIEPLGLGTVSVRESVDEAGRSAFILRTRDVTEPERIALHDTITSLGTEAEISRFTSIGPVIGKELKDKAVWAIGAVCLVIILYVAFAFRGVSYPVGSWMYGAITILVLVHDVLVPTAMMALLGHFLGYEIDVLFVMAILAVLGYSVNDTIVVFDRVRENLLRFRQEKKRRVKTSDGLEREEVTYILTKPFAQIVDQSVRETFIRSINTSLTTFLALLALYLVGGAVTQTFALVLMAGVVAGTYSSIFIANPLLVFAAERALRKHEHTQ